MSEVKENMEDTFPLDFYQRENKKKKRAPKKRMVPPDIDLDEINKWLTRGDKQRIAKSLTSKRNQAKGLHQTYVSEVLRGWNYNEDVINEAIRIAIERKTTHLQGINQLKQLR